VLNIVLYRRMSACMGIETRGDVAVAQRRCTYEVEDSEAKPIRLFPRSNTV